MGGADRANCDLGEVWEERATSVGNWSFLRLFHWGEEAGKFVHQLAPFSDRGSLLGCWLPALPCGHQPQTLSVDDL